MERPRVLLGGGASTPGLAQYLEWRVACCWKLAEDSTEGIEKVEVVSFGEGTEPHTIAASTTAEVDGASLQWEA